MDYLSEAKALQTKLEKIREDLHRHPELGNQEKWTSAFIEKILLDLGFEVKRMLGTALVATLHCGKGDRRVALRADMDALPVTESTGCSYSSQNPGVMHACGHDIHMTSALGAAMLLAKNMANLKGDVVLLFQPDEEGLGGAARMIAEGALDGVTAVFGGHVSPDIPLGTVGIKYRKFYAASNVYKVVFKGKSCHGATPEKGTDSLLSAAEVVTKIKTIHPSSGDKAVVSTGIFNSGTACNIIPGEAVIEGVIRTLGPDDRDEMENKFKAVIAEVCKKYGTTAEINLRRSHGGVVNTDAETELMERSAREVLGDRFVIVLDEPTMVTEDFGCFVDATSGCFCHIGAGCSLPLHSPLFFPGIEAAVTASAVYAKTLDNYLKVH